MKKSNRKKALTKSVVNRRSLQRCWILENGQYTHADEMHVGRLPYVALGDEDVLQENQIPYAEATRLNKKVLEYWSPDCDEREKVKAPLYTRMFEEYRYIGETYTGEKPTAQMVEKAIAMEESVKEKVQEKHQKEKHEKLYQEAIVALAGGWARYKDVKHKGYLQCRELKKGNDRILCFPVFDTKGNYLEGVVFFHVSRIPKDAKVFLKVPEEVSGWIKGRKGENLKAWTEKIGGNKIRLIQ